MKLSILLLVALSAASCASPQTRRSWTTSKYGEVIRNGNQEYSITAKAIQESNNNLIEDILSFGLAGWNLYETEKCRDKGFIELNRLYSKYPSDSRLFSSFFTTHIVAYVLERYVKTINIPVFGECTFDLLRGKAKLNFGLAIGDRRERKK